MNKILNNNIINLSCDGYGISSEVVMPVCSITSCLERRHPIRPNFILKTNLFRRNYTDHRENNKQYTEILSADAGWSTLKREPKNFLHNNSLVSGYFEKGSSSYFNRISHGKYQVSSTALSDSIVVNVEYVEVQKEIGLNFNNINGIDIDSVQQDVIATPLLTGCTMILQYKNGKRYLSHIQPVSESNPNQHLDLQKQLRHNGYETYGPEDYQDIPTRFWGIRNNNSWLFFIQQQINGNLIVKNIFQTRGDSKGLQPVD
ncbi:hypothetical protein [Photobacterium damselae]|uniref:hypothetical protein n=1 Tax=Photobacterium damselae TaxID=38293 RepID=UPI00165E0FF3|nr:hypothetical protein [Photobacterium damselae]